MLAPSEVKTLVDAPRIVEERELMCNSAMDCSFSKKRLFLDTFYLEFHRLTC